jgi:hypothetical protein
MLHAGSNRVSKAELAKTRTPKPTRSWQPIPHIELVNLVLDSLKRGGLTIANEAHALWREGVRYFGTFEVVDRDTRELHPDFGLIIGLRNSHDKSFPAGLAAGSCVFVCDNLAFSGEVTLARRHTLFIMNDLPELVTKAVGRLGALRESQLTRITRYKEVEINDQRAHDIIVRALDHNIIGPLRLPAVVEQWRKPAHEDFQPRNVWSLFNAFTAVLKGTNLTELPNRTTSLHGLMDLMVGLNPPSEN